MGPPGGNGERQLSTTSSWVDKEAARLTAAFVADLNEIGFLRRPERAGAAPGERSTLDAAIMIAITQANVAPLLRDPDRQTAFDGLDAPPPDELRRPVSIRSLADSLGLPAETVRRRVHRMAAEGVCVLSPRGVVVPQRVLASEHYTGPALETCARLGQLYGELRALGALGPPRHPAEAPSPGAFPHRRVMRIWGDHLLRSLDSVTRNLGDLVTVMLLLSILRANTEGGPGTSPRPVSVAALARRQGLPEETVRRYILRLTAEGRCLRTTRGLVLPPDVLDRPEWGAFTSAHLANLRRFFAALDAQGLLAEWEAGRSAAPEPTR